MNLNSQQGFVTIGYDNMENDHARTGSFGNSNSANEQEYAEPPECGAGSLVQEPNDTYHPDHPDADATSSGATGTVSTAERSSTSALAERSYSVDGDQVLDETDDDVLVPSVADFVQSSSWTPYHADERSVNDLHEYFSHFYSTRQVVKQAFLEFKRACQDIQTLLASGTLTTLTDTLTESGTETWLSASEERTIMTVLRSDPVLLVLGCKGSGKSSVINGILGEEILPNSAAMLKHPCNGIVRLCYDEVGYARIAGSSTERALNAEQRLSHQVREFIEEVMTTEERLSWGSLDNCVLEIGVKNPILRTRVQFLEIPGDCFDPRLRERLLRQLVVSSHQIVMYIIDGNKGLGNSDREFLFFLKASIPSMLIFYIINKVDYDPEAEEMDCESDAEADDVSGSGAERYHKSGVQTQKRKQKLVTDQLEKYKLAGVDNGKQTVFPVSVLRIRWPLEDGGSGQIREVNREYQAQYQTMLAALKDCLVQTGRSRMELALSTLFLIVMRTFDAFTRDTGDTAGEGARAQEQASKELIQQGFRQTKGKFKECKASFQKELEEIHRSHEAEIVSQCQKLEFGPLRLYDRIRNNEVEQQYREQINNYVLHLLNEEIRDSLVRSINELKQNLLDEIEKLKQQFSRDSGTRPSSPWEDMIRTHADEIIVGIVRLNFSVEWKAESGFLNWVKKLWLATAASKARPISLNSPEWKSEVAKEFYASIDLNTVVRKMFAGVDCTLKQAESDLLNLANSRHKFAAKLQKLLGKENPEALDVWRRVQHCLMLAEALRNLQLNGSLPSASLADTSVGTCIGRQCSLLRPYASQAPTVDSGVAVTITRLADSKSGSSAPQVFGLPNHHLVKGKEFKNQRQVAITLMVTFNDHYELCALHSAYQLSLRDYIEGTNCPKYTKVQCYQAIKDLLQIWHLFGHDKAPLQWSMQLDRLKVSIADSSALRVVYDYLENPVQTLRRGHSTALGLFIKSDADTRAENQAKELNNVLQLAFMLLVRSTQPFSVEELARIDDREILEERHREFKKYLAALVAKLPYAKEIDKLPQDSIANLWYTKFEQRAKSIDCWIEQCLQKALRSG